MAQDKEAASAEIKQTKCNLTVVDVQRGETAESINQAREAAARDLFQIFVKYV